MSRCLRRALAAAAAQLLALSVISAATSTITLSLPQWAVELNAVASGGLAHSPPVPQSTPRHDNHDEDLTTWASRAREQYAKDQDVQHAGRREAEIFLLVGAKTSVVHGFARRQAIRQTWASAASTPPGVQVVFLGCEPDLSVYEKARQQQLQEAIDLEKRVFGDLLTSELLQCHDTFAGLSDKVKAFFHWAATTRPTLAFTMLADDDIYVRLDRLVALLRASSTPSRRFFAGNAACDWCRGLGRTTRDPRNKYYIPRDTYPMVWLPPYLSGQHVLVSGDLVHFISRNFHNLRGLGALDDVTLGLWLFAALRVRQTWWSQFQSLRFSESCSDDALISFADLSVFAMNRIHENVSRGGRFCEGFELATWLKQAHGTEKTKNDGTYFNWSFQYNPARNRLSVAVQVTMDSASVDLVYHPSATSAEDGLCGRAATLLRDKHYVIAEDKMCNDLIASILSALNESVLASPGLAPSLSIARHNMRRLLVDDEIDTIEYIKNKPLRAMTEPVERFPFTAMLSKSASMLRVLIECLFVQLHAEKRVLVWDEDDTPSQHKTPDVFVATSLDATGFLRGCHVYTSVILVIDEPATPLLPVTRMDQRIVIFNSANNQADDSSALYIPQASRVFARTMKYTPTMLLHPQRDNSSAPVEQPRLRVFPSFRQLNPPDDLAVLIELMQGHIEVAPAVPCASVSNSGGSGEFDLDDCVDTIRGAKFVIIASAHADDSSDALVVAFLAGAIPVYVGPSSSSSAGDCAHQILLVHSSATLYSQMSLEPPITDLRAFEEAFSWHPAVVKEMLAREPPTGATRMSERLQRLLG